MTFTKNWSLQKYLYRQANYNRNVAKYWQAFALQLQKYLVKYMTTPSLVGLDIEMTQAGLHGQSYPFHVPDMSEHCTVSTLYTAQSNVHRSQYEMQLEKVDNFV